MNVSHTILKIKNLTFMDYAKWGIGVTDDPSIQQTVHGNPMVWYQWKPDTGEDSREIEKTFLDFGMSGLSGAPGNATFVYIYKKSE